MRYSKIILLSTLSAFALLTTTATSQASLFSSSATDVGLLKPHANWQVGPIDAKNTSYCAMINQFDKEISLAFARSNSGYGSLAIDFPGSILETGTTYPVTVQVDDTEARQYNVRASSPHSIIIQIGQDEDFYSSLGGNGTLHIGMPTVDMKFDLRKFSSSYISLISCSDKLPQQHGSGPKTAAMPVSPVEKLPLAGATTQVPAADKVMSADKGLKPVILTPPPVKLAFATMAPNADSPPALTAMPAPPPSQVMTQKSEDDLQIQMDAVRKSLHEIIDVHTAENTSPALGVQPKSAGMTTGDTLTAEEKASAVVPPHAAGIVWTAENKQDDSKTGDQNYLVNKLANENKAITEENTELKKKLAQAEVSESSLGNKVSVLKAEKDDLQAKLDMQDRQSKLMQAALSAKERDLSAIRSLSVEDSKTLADVQGELNSLKRDHSSTVADLQSKLAEKSAQYDSLQKQFSDAGVASRSAEDQVSKAQTELDQSRERFSQAQVQLAASEQQKSELSSQIESQSQQNKTLLGNMQQELEKARDQVSMLESQMMSVALQRDDLSSQMDLKQKENNELQQSIKGKEKDLASQLDLQQRENEALQTSLKQKERDLTALQQPKPEPVVQQSSPPVASILAPVTKPQITKGLKDNKAPIPAIVDVSSLPLPMPAAVPSSSEKNASLYPPPLPSTTGKVSKNLSSSEKGPLPAITSPQIVGQDKSLAPLLKVSAEGSKDTLGPTDESWDTVVVQ